MVQGAAFRILACFYDTEVFGFAELCKKARYPTDLGGYYIRQLIASGHLEKIERGQYRLLPKGKQEIARRYGRKIAELQPRLMVLIVASQGDSCVVMRRERQPFIGVAEWPAGTVSGGETINGAAQRIANDRLGVAAKLETRGFFRRVDRYQDMLFDDKLFAVMQCEIPRGDTIKEASDIGTNVLCAAETLASVESPSRALHDVWRFALSNDDYAERIYDLTAQDLGISPGDLSVGS